MVAIEWKGTNGITAYFGLVDIGRPQPGNTVMVSAAGARFRFTADGIQNAIREAGMVPKLRNQQYEFRALPEGMAQQGFDWVHTNCAQSGFPSSFQNGFIYNDKNVNLTNSQTYCYLWP